MHVAPPASSPLRATADAACVRVCADKWDVCDQAGTGCCSCAFDSGAPASAAIQLQESGTFQELPPSGDDGVCFSSVFISSQC